MYQSFDFKSFLNYFESTTSKLKFNQLSEEINDNNLINDDSIQIIVKKLNKPAQKFLMFVCQVYGLLKATGRMKLTELYNKLNNDANFSFFKQSKLQMLGLLLMFFEECFNVINYYNGIFFCLLYFYDIFKIINKYNKK